VIIDIALEAAALEEIALEEMMLDSNIVTPYTDKILFLYSKDTCSQAL
jgi:hypothetical protein